MNILSKNGFMKIIVFDTCNYQDYPVGGQLTSILNFLRFCSEENFDCENEILLVGVTKNRNELGNIQHRQIGGKSFRFLPVALGDANLNGVRESLRYRFLKGLIRSRKVLTIERNDICFIHTPEAYLFAKLSNLFARKYVFVHGSYIGLSSRTRFFRKSPLIKCIWQQYLNFVLRDAVGLFVLGETNRHLCERFNKNLCTVYNSIVPCEKSAKKAVGVPVNFVFAGRLAQVKDIEPLIEAVESFDRDCRFLIVGDGEEHDTLRKVIGKRSKLLGSVENHVVKSVLGDSDILLMNSKTEGIPMVILEAIDLGLPVITTNVGAISEILDPGVDSEFTDGTVKSIQEKMRKVLDAYEYYSENAQSKSKRFHYRQEGRKILDFMLNPRT